MKLLTLMLIISIVAQPLQAGFCDMEMETGQESQNHMDHPMDRSMGHAMDHSSDEPAQSGHNCCETSEADSDGHCDSQMDCGNCLAGPSALPVLNKSEVVASSHKIPAFPSQSTFSGFPFPFLRPPIS